MTVAELRAALATLPAGADGWTVVLSRDSEGNGFSPLRDCTTGLYVPHPDGPCRCDFLAAEDLGPTDQNWGPDAVCLWPLR